MSKKQLTHLGIGLVFLLLQVVLFRHLTVFHAQPDLVLIFLVWYMSRQNRTAALLMAALLGFFQDFLLDLWGLHMFTKTLLVYISHRFIPKTRAITLSIGPVGLTVLLAAFLQNLIFLGLNMFIQNYSAELLFWNHLIGSSLYSAVIASVIYLFRNKS
ncbi:rod shape-determining protein MreD [Fodinibius salsisoli]|uniref:Rod shape-determining protein MreD n=1 Tax=Fodinibius salsisoli TaxID=2820877 RepID=A0ABT3PPG4_9BACT|nr:rod shape-determining protein MreD [Fodinibius salsisoli]MCW9707759.1 rod shape-determining protein MreD [Fodinibius salsisoli]